MHETTVVLLEVNETLSLSITASEPRFLPPPKVSKMAWVAGLGETLDRLRDGECPCIARRTPAPRRAAEGGTTKMEYQRGQLPET